jgi:hypothetical protein
MPFLLGAGWLFLRATRQDFRGNAKHAVSANESRTTMPPTAHCVFKARAQRNASDRLKATRRSPQVRFPRRQ